jgi:hypothetical protein
MPSDTAHDLKAFRLSPADLGQHLGPIAQITADAFAGGQYVQEIGEQYIGHCHYDGDTTRLIWDGERLVHHWGVWGYAMRLETAALKVAGIGAVATEEAYRKRGLMALAARASFEAMQAKGYDLTILRGRHYAKFGYVRAWNYVTYRLTPEEVVGRPTPRPYEALEPARLDEWAALYNESHRAYTGTAVRPTYRTDKGGELKVYGWTDETGHLAGYVRALPSEDKKTLRCLEAAGDPEQGLAVLAEVFKAGAYEALTFFTLPHRHPLLATLRRGACVVETQYFHETGWRVRLVNLQSTLEKIRLQLEARLQRSGLAQWRGALYLDGGEQQANLNIAAGQVQIAPPAPGAHSLRGGAALARLLIGSDEPAEVIQQAGMTCTGQAAELAEVLFPNLYPMLSEWDEY